MATGTQSAYSGPGGFSTSSWIFLPSSTADTIALQKQIDELLTASAFSFYPEAEWGMYGYRPPESHKKILGAWRNPDGCAFVFLLDNPAMVAPGKCDQTLLSFVGPNDVLVQLRTDIEKLKIRIGKQTEQRESDNRLKERIVDAQTSTFTVKLIGLGAVITAAINAFAIYIRKLPPPHAGERALEIYSDCVVAIHISALVLLFSFIVICTLFVWMYGSLLLRKL